MPPIELFAGLDAVRSSAPVTSGLPTREELQKWLVEHDKIEKETEAFDSGELKKLKTFTKAASKRNLSPQDTDIIELTLTTIYEFDKLLHLLRDRSEHLDLLGIRLTWEEQRCAAWVDLRQLMLDIHNFLAQRATWSPSAYDGLPQTEAPPPVPSVPSRRGSVASMASEHSTSSSSGFSRSARFKLADALSREAAQFAGRISALRHGKVAAAGKALDKLMDGYRRPIPDELLDEQDKVEQQGMYDLDNVGKFIMNVVSQWRRSDELYVETIKDQTSAQSLIDDVETALLGHPSSRQDSTFSARASAIIKRLAARENPASSTSTFPRPSHALFPHQTGANESIVQILHEELDIGTSLARKLEKSILEYHAACEAVKAAERSIASADDLSESYDTALTRMLNGVESSNGDGTPPDLTSQSCLRETKHAAFLALLPSLLQELDRSDEEYRRALPAARAALLSLGDINVDPDFKDRLAASIQRLEDIRAESERTRKDLSERVGLLRDVRKIWVSAGDVFSGLGTIRGDIGDVIEQQKWRSKTTSQLPPTPESSNEPLPLSAQTLEDAAEQVKTLQATFTRDVRIGIDALPATLGSSLRAYLAKRRDGLSTVFDHTQRTIRLADSINRQALVMAEIRDETHNLEARLEDAEGRYDALAEGFLDVSLSDEDLNAQRSELTSDATKVQNACQTSMDSLARRVVFVSPEASNSTSSSTASPGLRRRFSSSLDLTLDALQDLPPLGPPIDLTQLDHIVRSDCNSFALRLAAGVSSLQQKMVNLDVVQDARAVDAKLSSVMEAVTHAIEGLETLRTSVSGLPDTFDVIPSLAQTADEETPRFDTRRSEISRSMSPIRQLLQRMDAACDKCPSSRHLLSSRSQALDEVETKFKAWSDDAKALLSDIRQREERLRTAQKEWLERKRLEAEAAERLRREQAEAEARLQAERERAEKERAEMERAEKERIEKERVEREREEQERAERERVERERADRERLERERAEKKRAEKEAREREEAEAAERARREQAEAEERARRERAEAEERERAEREAAQERLRREAEAASVVAFPTSADDDSASDVSDVFGTQGLSEDLAEMQSLIAGLRQRLRSLGINVAARPSPSSTSSLPTVDQHTTMAAQLTDLSIEAAQLPDHVSNPIVDAELQSLQSELEASHQLLPRILSLARFGKLVQDCDNALSDLLEHIDSYPAPPSGPLSANYVSSSLLPPEEQLSDRLSFTKGLIGKLEETYAPVIDDFRAPPERERVVQTWVELESMAFDRINGRKSRPASTMSSGRNSRASVDSSQRPTLQKKTSQYSTLSAGPSSRGRGRPSAPAHPSTSSRRVTSHNAEPNQNRSSSRLSVVSSNRSVSGPGPSSSRLFSSTFSSRQRTTSLSSNAGPGPVPSTPSRRFMDPLRPPRHPAASRARRTASPAPSEASVTTRSIGSTSRSTAPSHPTWGRPPKLSFPSSGLLRSPPKIKPPPPKRKPYVANPKSKLDVAVGDVVNKLAVDIRIEVAHDTWQDQSGKYWIGGEDPKLCFCRILRSHTVMVRVGGGWMELSKFIQTHFADMFRLLPEPTPQIGSREEKWITSATLLEAPELITTPPRAPKTPEPRGSGGAFPSFVLSTPSGKSPHSIRTHSSPGSPLTALQFLRRVDGEDSFLRPSTPTKGSLLRNQGRASLPLSQAKTPVRNPVWKP